MKSILDNLPWHLRSIPLHKNVQEIRLRAGKPIIFETACGREILKKTITQEDISKTLEVMTASSIYSHISEISRGFITLQGGHRVGLCGRAVCENEKITNIANISGLNIRIASPKIGAAEKLVEWASAPTNFVIISPPGFGKTTLLRDYSRIIGNKFRVSIVDERGEIAAPKNGVAQFDIGINADVLSFAPKPAGIENMVRSMNPQIIAIDEIATADDAAALQYAQNCGVKTVCTAHGASVKDVKKRISANFDFAVLIKEGFTYDKVAWNELNPF